MVFDLQCRKMGLVGQPGGILNAGSIGNQSMNRRPAYRFDDFVVDPEAWRLWWQDPETRLIHFIGKDNVVFHTLMFPAMLMAHSEDYVLPDNVPANEFLNLEGQKLSTSRGFAVWLPDYLEKFQADPLRYTLARNLPETRDMNFTWEGFLARNDNELGNNFGNLINSDWGRVDSYTAPSNVSPATVAIDNNQYVLTPNASYDPAVGASSVVPQPAIARIPSAYRLQFGVRFRF